MTTNKIQLTDNQLLILLLIGIPTEPVSNIPHDVPRQRITYQFIFPAQNLQYHPIFRYEMILRLQPRITTSRSRPISVLRGDRLRPLRPEHG